MNTTKKIRIFATEADAAKAVPPGTLRKLKIGAYTLCLANTHQGFMAISDACPHQLASLSGGTLNARLQVICPLHQKSYSLITGEEGSKRTPPAETFKVETTEEGIFVHIPA
ncbi:Rieske 2Fe-2S domain-containing protein [Cesiribacter sp. SM1]|uniref:Rieske (2Fe-2S) protein n=1 Tax=Cesiribacter sp. SM1 TaxID=2861196 RepID=UPI001CD20DB6|nr:Rieske 2Fe-2S domain-containing protein [Cesiribacter sp. SM1]